MLLLETDPSVQELAEGHSNVCRCFIAAEGGGILSGTTVSEFVP